MRELLGVVKAYLRMVAQVEPIHHYPPKQARRRNKDVPTPAPVRKTVGWLVVIFQGGFIPIPEGADPHVFREGIQIQLRECLVEHFTSLTDQMRAYLSSQPMGLDQCKSLEALDVQRDALRRMADLRIFGTSLVSAADGAQATFTDENAAHTFAQDLNNIFRQHTSKAIIGMQNRIHQQLLAEAAGG